MLVSNLSHIANSRPLPQFYGDLPKTGAPIDRLAYLGSQGDLLYEQAYVALNKVAGEDDLSDQGKDKSRKAIAASYSTQIKKLVSEIDTYTAEIVSKARKTVTPPTPPSDARMAEVRSMIERTIDGDSLRMQAFITERVEAGDVEAVDAILDSPAFWPVRSIVPSMVDLKSARVTMGNAVLGEETAAVMAAEIQLDNHLGSMVTELDLMVSGPTDRVADIANGVSDDDG